ncbi:MAG: replication initiation protein [Sulfurimonas sp.]|nr:replication initiation protein [Sulfurimonas sp.]
MKNKKINALVVKSNDIVEASYKLSLQEQRIILYMASRIMPDDEDFKPVRLYIDDFVKILQVEGKSKHKEIEEITNKLRKRDLIIKKAESILQIGWLSSAEYFYGKGFVELEFSPKLKPYLLQLKERFTKYQLNSVIRLKHSYSVRFYELLKQYESIGWRFFVLEELKDILGIGADEYSLYSNFKLKVLNPVKKEFDLKYSKQELDFTFEYEEKKEGRKVAGLKFEILKPSIQPELFESVVDESKYNQHQESLYAELKALKLSKKQIVSLIEKHPLEVIQRNIELVQKKAANKEIKNIPAFLFDAIEGDFASNQAQDYDPEYGSLISKAKSCWAKNKGGCAAVWSNYKNVKNHECHYCKKFDEQRARV